MFKKLLPKEEKYFEDFKEMISLIEEMATHTEKVFQFDEPSTHILKMKPLELRCDEITYKITKRLNKTFITPFDREDIFALIKRLDDISDMLLGATVRVENFHIDKKIDYADKLASIIREQVKELGAAIQDLKVKRVNELKAVKALEVEADRIYQQATKELFEKEKDAIELIKKKEIIDLLEDTADKCQSTANVILSIFIKNA
ncbi:MAG: DUF47 family protein [Ignavibacteriaceae bacterium]|nr:DUF47 family protein [Ignavibacterium sp.]MCC6254027.1 DUF47 family protein [Ignavibacteriaceae bacterium]HMN23943.1 DUF47 family protein [Ignavibacteriaceae bacterium]HRN25078.1 DUF47 family protein [Ignavibacteriaceae bacterium]HRP91773.1 DUF47 family protein [Ignavibacteriaceae bacterium]